jgi:hypothetical protein
VTKTTLETRAPGLVYIESAAGDGIIYTGELPDDSFGSYSLDIAPNSSGLDTSIDPKLPGIPLPDIGLWAYVPDVTNLNPLSFSDPSAIQIQTILGDVARLTVTGEVIDGLDDVLAIDNFHITLVPIPAALPLMLSALVGVAFAAGRRS